jgi:hypothetical protein
MNNVEQGQRVKIRQGLATRFVGYCGIAKSVDRQARTAFFAATLRPDCSPLPNETPLGPMSWDDFEECNCP